MLAAGGLDIADAFSTDLYAGNGSTRTITNGVDLASEGGMVWIKGRTGTRSALTFDTERGATRGLQTANDQTEWVSSSLLTSFTGSGFTIGGEADVNQSGGQFVSWTFRKAPRFFDVVTYTGNGSLSRQLPHNLGVKPGIVIVKARVAESDTAANNWGVAAVTSGVTAGYLNTTAAFTQTVNQSKFTDSNVDPYAVVNTWGQTKHFNESGSTYVAYLFAHDTDDDGVIQCGSYTGNGSATGPVVTLGWEPQWLMIKSASTSGSNWEILDSARGLDGVSDKRLYANLANAEGTFEQVETSATGFNLVTAGPALNVSATEYIYMAIRKEGA
jgi:hypothetical protein